MLTIGDVIQAARVILQDQEPEFRYTDANLYGAFSEAISEVRRLRPDLVIASLFDPPTSYTSADAGVAFPITAMYRVAVTNYLVGRAELQDDQFNSDGRASSMLSAFKAQLSTATA